MRGIVLAAAGIVRDGAGRVLLTRRGHAPAAGRWAFPGGRVEADETPVEAVRRELLEECGLDVRVGPLVHYAHVVATDRDFLILDYVCDVIGGALKPGDDSRELMFAGEADVRGLKLAVGMAACLRRRRIRAYLGWV